jgi:hypothetical protein
MLTHCGSAREGGNRPPSQVLVMKRNASGRGQPACWSGLAPQPQKNEAMEY